LEEENAKRRRRWSGIELSVGSTTYCQRQITEPVVEKWLGCHQVNDLKD
jgi:hypothetical protein